MATSFYSRNRSRLNLLGHVIQLDGQQRAMRHQEKKADLFQRMGAAAAGVPYPEKSADEDMINVGDTHIHQSAPAPSKGLGNLAKALIGAGLLATGVGSGIGGMLIADAVKNWKPPAFQDTDTDTTLDIELVPNP